MRFTSKVAPRPPGKTVLRCKLACLVFKKIPTHLKEAKGLQCQVFQRKWWEKSEEDSSLSFYYVVFTLTDMNTKHTFLSSFCFQAPLNTPVTEDRFGILTEKYRIPVPVLPGKE